MLKPLLKAPTSFPFSETIAAPFVETTKETSLSSNTKDLGHWMTVVT